MRVLFKPVVVIPAVLCLLTTAVILCGLVFGVLLNAIVPSIEYDMATLISTLAVCFTVVIVAIVVVSAMYFEGREDVQVDGAAEFNESQAEDEEIDVVGTVGDETVILREIRNSLGWGDPPNPSRLSKAPRRRRSK